MVEPRTANGTPVPGKGLADREGGQSDQRRHGQISVQVEYMRGLRGRVAERD